jgi:hypothetical protein
MNKKLIVLILSTCFAHSTWAALSPCDKYKQIKSRLAHAEVEYIDDLIRHNEWLDERYDRANRRGVTLNVLRIMIMGVNWTSFLFIPTRAETATRTGYFSRNPENFINFLQIDTRHACQYLAMPDRDADKLRAINHEAWRKLTPQAIRNLPRP